MGCLYPPWASAPYAQAPEKGGVPRTITCHIQAHFPFIFLGCTSTGGGCVLRAFACHKRVLAQVRGSNEVDLACSPLDVFTPLLEAITLFCCTQLVTPSFVIFYDLTLHCRRVFFTFNFKFLGHPLFWSTCHPEQLSLFCVNVPCPNVP